MGGILPPSATPRHVMPWVTEGPVAAERNIDLYGGATWVESSDSGRPLEDDADDLSVPTRASTRC
jgi:hypothetical protein